MLQDWDFTDETLNSTTPQINRQKSVRNLEIVKLDSETGVGVLFDPKKNATNTASLKQCDCHNFGFVGKSPRKTFKPCMHIYRLAMELCLIEARNLDYAGKRAQLGQRKQAETDRLRQLERDREQWGQWNYAVHESRLQKNRQYRAYAIKHEESSAICFQGDHWVVHSYNVNLEHCQCGDFLDRRLPCKHIYVVALEAGISLPLSFDEYKAAREKGADIVFRL